MLRSFSYDGQWNIMYYPKKPSGFSVFIIGDHHHYVSNLDSYWLQHPGRLQIIEQLQQKGYTCFSSNLYGEHWGNDKAVQLAETMYQYVMKQEILNHKIHILAEGKGALVALKLMKKYPEWIRSIVLMNPCLSIRQRWETEQERIVFLQPFMDELSKAYSVTKKDDEKYLDEKQIHVTVPLKILHVLGNDMKKHLKMYKQLQKMNKSLVDVVYLLPEKRYKVALETIRFFNEHENVL